MTMTAWQTDVAPTLEEAQAFVGGYVEMVVLDDGSQMLVDEEGLLKNYVPNLEASALANRLIVGNALILAGKAKWT